ncbi:MAG: SGNH/GDSL hydrolase family protein [Xanthomonadales bacterium]|jgi:lysophospholipase L1-like esterase|nr:SGNH/GDSL hydrolase family protein [Xanthomonadales bacterium]
MLRNLMVVLVSIGVALLLGELLLRAIGDTEVRPAGERNRLDAEVAYEPVPGAWVSPQLTPERRDQLDGRGLRTPHPEARPPGTLRVLGLGDSVVQAVEVAYPETWLAQLEGLLGGELARPLQTINGGVGGYVSWQVAPRLLRHGLRYDPDVLVVIVGWNDLYFGSRPNWRSRITLADFHEARPATTATAGAEPATETRSWKARLRDMSALANLLAEVRAKYLLAREYDERIKASRQSDCVTEFNAAALEDYRRELAVLLQTATAQGLPLALVRFPTLVGDAAATPEEQEKMLVYYRNSPLCHREYRQWHARYLEAIDAFAAAHPQLILIDAHQAFEALPQAEKAALFVDLAHLTPAGNRRLAEVVATRLLAERARWLDAPAP